jgi:hypothetical protein
VRYEEENTMSKLSEKLDKIFSAITFAESGEFDTAKEIMAEKSASSASSASKRVLLALRGVKVDRRTLTYAMNMCKRIDADLDIMYVSRGGQISPDIEQFTSELETDNVGYTLVRVAGSLKQEILNYTNSHRDVLFVIIDSMEDLDGETAVKSKSHRKSWINLKCPLVVVKEDIVQAV